MRNRSNVLIGLSATALGAVLILWITPSQTVPALFASVPSGFYPNFTSGMLIVSGLCLMVSGFFSGALTTASTSSAMHIAVRFFAALTLLAGGMYATLELGFVAAGIAICILTLVLMREKRWPLIAAVSISAPLAIWVGFELLLERPLP